MDAAAAGAVASAAIAAIAFGFAYHEYRERRRQQLLIDLQGDREAVAAVANRIRRGKPPWRIRHGKLSLRIRHPWRRRVRPELFEAMCLAAVFESSGRSRSLLYAALAKMMANEEYRKMIMSNVEDISNVIARNSPYTDLDRARRRLFALRAALSVNDDLRIRVERIDDCLTQPGDKHTFDERCDHDIHRWGVIKKVLERRKSIVLVCPSSRAYGDAQDYPTIALDFHETAQLQDRHEKFQLTECGTRLESVKSTENAANPGSKLNSIARELASVIVSHPIYAKASVIAVVPGIENNCSDQLGTIAALEVTKLGVPITKKIVVNTESESEPLDSSFVEAVKGRDVILVYDTYRTGSTLRAAARVLRRAEASNVFGLTVTCTVSAIVSHFGGD